MYQRALDKNIAQIKTIQTALAKADSEGMGDSPQAKLAKSHERVVLVRPDAEALAEAVLELLEDAGGRDALGRQARRAAAEAFSIEGFLAKYAVLYSRLHRGEDLSDLPFVIT